MKIYEKLLEMNKNQKGYFVLIDPDNITPEVAAERALLCQHNGVDGILVGGSIMLNDHFNKSIKLMKAKTNIPIIIFPGIFNFVSPDADALLLLSVVSSRNPQMLIGEQVRAAPLIKRYGLECIGTAYMLIESGVTTSVHFMSNSQPIPAEKNDIAVAHALAGEYLGMKCVYMDGGSGAKYPIKNKMIQEVKKNISVPLIVGGGIRTPEVAAEKIRAGADIVVTGNILEDNFDTSKIKEFADAIHNAAK